MDVLESVLGVVVLCGSGVLAGVLFAVALSVVPALASMPPDRYVWAHQLLGRRYDRVMPCVTVSSALSALFLASREPDSAHAVPFVLAAVCLAGVALVSQTRNVPINNRVKAMRPEDAVVGWDDPRRAWRNWHLLRTGLALTACLLAATATVAR